jgi:hypothetical protein
MLPLMAPPASAAKGLHPGSCCVSRCVSRFGALWSVPRLSSFGSWPVLCIHTHRLPRPCLPLAIANPLPPASTLSISPPDHLLLLLQLIVPPSSSFLVTYYSTKLLRLHCPYHRLLSPPSSAFLYLASATLQSPLYTLQDPRTIDLGALFFSALIFTAFFPLCIPSLDSPATLNLYSVSFPSYHRRPLSSLLPQTLIPVLINV